MNSILHEYFLKSRADNFKFRFVWSWKLSILRHHISELKLLKRLVFFSSPSNIAFDIRISLSQCNGTFTVIVIYLGADFQGKTSQTKSTVLLVISSKSKKAQLLRKVGSGTRTWGLRMPCRDLECYTLTWQHNVVTYSPQ